MVVRSMKLKSKVLLSGVFEKSNFNKRFILHEGECKNIEMLEGGGEWCFLNSSET